MALIDREGLFTIGPNQELWKVSKPAGEAETPPVLGVLVSKSRNEKASFRAVRPRTVRMMISHNAMISSGFKNLSTFDVVVEF